MQTAVGKCCTDERILLHTVEDGRHFCGVRGDDAIASPYAIKMTSTSIADADLEEVVGALSRRVQELQASVVVVIVYVCKRAVAYVCVRTYVCVYVYMRVGDGSLRWAPRFSSPTLI